MSSNKNTKWLSSVSLTKLASRITRTLSISSKTRQPPSKKTNKVAPQSQTIPTNSFFTPKSVSTIRRHSPRLISQILRMDNSRQTKHNGEANNANSFRKKKFEGDFYEEKRHLAQYNLSLFNVSAENLHDEPEEHDEIINNKIDMTMF
ncbi:unnamed protein product [Rotaria magnacalcarata]|uniref:Uncharacterized protein n=1 Tax=Rotaria magnacalcarata TaxID=392030 RepID=A0A816URH4_9BILA|nr:unnamed protein product [Rotaria magnacalcarata]CAF3789497.1 unnamed protein product [Rotaria magnacalcarata]